MSDFAHGVSFREPLFAACPDCGKIPQVITAMGFGMNMFVVKCGCRRMEGESYTGLHSCGVEAVRLRALAQTAIDWNVGCSHRRYLREKGIVPIKPYWTQIRFEGDRIFVKRELPEDGKKQNS